MEGADISSAGSPAGSPDAPDPVLSPEASLGLPPNGVRPNNANFGRMQRRSFERGVFDALSYRHENRAASLSPLDTVILHRMRTVFGIEIPEQRMFWPYDPLELLPLLDEIEFLNTPPQRFSVNQPTDVLSYRDKLPLLTAELARQRAGVIGRLKRMGGGTSELFSRDLDSFFEDATSNDVPEESRFEIHQFEDLDLGDRALDDAIKRVLTTQRASQQFFFRKIFAEVGVSPGRAKARADKRRAADVRDPRSVLQVFRGGPAY